MEPTPIFAALTHPDDDRTTPRGTHGAHGSGRSVTDLLRELRHETPGAGRATSVGRVPGLLTFPRD
ncbi:hypothetical protein PHK61_02070 [Actinomycetospora lutea]|uniref:hypothetical protein n=1 Tax=Actinomycetospora lutea TaxID=663604 RepID=UPI00236716F8|nr:hypothetical protein [Actinomycetospora lutea]MDD7937201.1 hypothetical protein [Actinomycetospora lutea]